VKLLNISEQHMFGRWRSQVAKRSARRVRHGGYPSWMGRRNCLVALRHEAWGGVVLTAI
jgi:hypothetical protein